MSYIIKSVASCSTTANVFIEIPEFNLIPAAGKYLISFSSVVSSTDSSSISTFSIFIGNVEQTDSTRMLFGAEDGNSPRMRVNVHCQTLSDLNGNQHVSVRWKTEKGTLKVQNRNLVLLKQP
jgi:hypothetical protein